METARGARLDPAFGEKNHEEERDENPLHPGCRHGRHVCVRLLYPQLKQRIVEEAQRHANTTVLIEDAGSGMSLIQDLHGEGQVRPIPIKPMGDKVTRASAGSAKIEAGHVLLPESAPWLDDFKAEVLAFPHGRHDDQVDSMSQFLTWMGRRQPKPREVTIRFLGGPRSGIIDHYRDRMSDLF